MFCSNCGQFIEEGKAFCKACGSPVPSPPEARTEETVIEPGARSAPGGPAAGAAQVAEAASSPVVPPAPSAGFPPSLSQLGRYQVACLIGRGGMATVYRAQDPVLDRVVAIKVMHSHLADDPTFVSRFRHEAQAVAALRHPNIVKVYDFGNDGQSYYMVMEYVDGPTLAALMGAGVGERPETEAIASGSRGGLSTGEVLRIFPPLCSAIDYATSRGMVHRDIKPANILLTSEGEPILTDYGIAKIMGATSYTSSGVVMGSARYMSPEQVQGLTVDHRSDIYALGVVLFEAVAGRVPYEAPTTASILAQHLSAPVPAARALNPKLPPDIQAVLERALAKEPERRYQRAGDLATALQSVLAPPQVATYGPPPVAAAPSAPILAPALAPTMIVEVGARPPGTAEQAPTRAPAAAPPRFERAGPSAAAQMAPAPPLPPPPAPIWEPPSGPTGRKGRTGLVVGIVAAVVIVLAGAGLGSYFAFFRDADTAETTTTVVSASSTTEGETSSTGGVTTTTGGGTTTSVTGATTTQTIPGLTTSTSGPSTTEDVTGFYLDLTDELVMELEYDDTRIPELAAEINSTAPDVPVWVRDELSTMLGSLDSLNVEVASLDVPAGFEDSSYWLEEAVMHMGTRIDATIQGVQAIWDAGKVSAAANDFFGQGRTERDAYRAAMEKYYEFLPIE